MVKIEEDGWKSKQEIQINKEGVKLYAREGNGEITAVNENLKMITFEKHAKIIKT